MDKKKIWLIIVSVLLVVAIAVGITLGLLLYKKDNPTPDGTGNNGISKDAKETWYTRDELEAFLKTNTKNFKLKAIEQTLEMTKTNYDKLENGQKLWKFNVFSVFYASSPDTRIWLADAEKTFTYSLKEGTLYDYTATETVYLDEPFLFDYKKQSDFSKNLPLLEVIQRLAINLNSRALIIQ